MNLSYKVITAGALSIEDSTKLLADRVNLEINKGWEPLGGISVAIQHRTDKSPFYESAQSVIHKGK